MKKLLLPLAASVVVAASVAPAAADVRVGMLECQVAPGVSFIIGSAKNVRCHFRGNTRHEFYAGRISRIGIDLGFTNGGTLAWAVYASTRPGAGALAGNYVGATAEATVAAGVHGNLLVGGFRDSVTLQPLSVGAQSGLDAALTVSNLQLEPVAGHRHKRGKRSKRR